jgi:hypothetical protein
MERPAAGSDRSTPLGMDVGRGSASGVHEGFQMVMAICQGRDAPIWKVADYGAAGERCEMVPILTAAMKKGNERAIRGGFHGADLS